MRIDENTNQLIYNLYESGLPMNAACEIFSLSLSYTRQKARDVITKYINKNFGSFENITTPGAKAIHPILQLHPLRTRELIELLQQDSKGKDINQYPEPPSVF